MIPPDDLAPGLAVSVLRWRGRRAEIGEKSYIGESLLITAVHHPFIRVCRDPEHQAGGLGIATLDVREVELVRIPDAWIERRS